MTVSNSFSRLFVLVFIASFVWAAPVFGDVRTDRLGITGMEDGQNTPDDRRGESRRRERQNPEDTQKTNEAKNAIKTNLDEILTAINTGQEPRETVISAADDTLMTSRRYLNDFEQPTQADYFLLAAWVSFYQGDLDKAAKAAARAYQLNNASNDIKASYIALAIMDDQDIDPIVQMEKRAALMQARGHQMNNYSSRSSMGKLTFKADELEVDLIGKSVPDKELKCVSAAEFPPAQGKNLCILFWQLDERTSAEAPGEDAAPADPCEVKQRRNQPQPQPQPGPGPMMMPGDPMGMGAPMPMAETTYQAPSRGDAAKNISEQMEQFGNWFRFDNQNPDLMFLAVNTDSLTNRNAVLDMMLTTPMPWATVMAHDPANAGLDFDDIDIPGRAVLAIVNTQGTVIYAGPATNRIPSMILEDLVVMGSRKAPEQSAQSAPAAQETAAPAAAAPAAAPAENPDDKMSEGEKIKAQEMLNTAEQFIKMKVAGFKRGVDLCREVMQNWPGTSYADRARQILNQIPERYHARYKLTPKELGR